MLVEANYLAAGTITVILGAATYSDIRWHRIPNVIVFCGVLAALTMQLWSVGWPGLLTGIGGLTAGLAMLLPFYLLGGMAAGDVKLMAAAGAFLGPMGSVLAAAITLIVGAIGGLVVLVMRKGLTAIFARYLAMGKCLFVTGQVSYLPPEQGEVAGSRFPYAAAVAIGVLTVVFWHPFGV